jgi:dethiobiotin synthetase
MRVLVTGTGARVGKTWVACALARALRAGGRPVIAIKPVETGRSGPPSDWEDGVRLAKATGQQQPTHAIIRLPVQGAPVLGGEGVENEIDYDALLLKIERYIAGTEFGLVEGIGGLLTPITWEWNITDLARDLGACALVVAEDQLGAINHSLLTLSALELAGIPCAGLVLTTPQTTDSSTGANAVAISRLSGLDRVMTVPRAADPADVAGAILPVVTWLSRVAAPA